MQRVKPAKGQDSLSAYGSEVICTNTSSEADGRNRSQLERSGSLLNLAPGIQKAILFLPRVEQGDDPVTERELRETCGVEDWAEQERLWR